MNQFAKKILENTALCTVLALTALMLLGTGMAGAQITYLDDGAIPNNAGGWDLPAQGSCTTDLGLATRPECLGLRLVAASSTACTTAGGSWSTSVCNDTLALDATACNAKPDRYWNAGTGICAVVMQDDDRNDVVCMMHNGTWVTSGACTGTWVMPVGGAYNPPVLNANPLLAAGAGDQCLRCHNGRTQYNGPRVRDTQETLYQGHKNMARKVTVPMPWGGPPFACTGFPAETTEESCFLAGGVWDPTIYPGTDSGQDFDWVNGTVDIGAAGSPNPRNLYWIYADWLSAYPRAVYHDVPNTTTNPDKPNVSYSCARCHTTGWTADATLRTDKEPEKSFPGITWDGVTDAVAGQVNLAPGAPFTEKMASWDEFGISCARCHNSAVDMSGGACDLACTTQSVCERATNATSPGPGCGGVWNLGLGVCEKPAGTAFPNYIFATFPTTCTAVAGSFANVPPFPAPVGMSTHHNDLTGPTVGSSGTGGYCTDPRFSGQTQCDEVGAAWLTSCSVPGSCSLPAFTTSGTCFLGGGTWTKNNSTTLCTTAGGTWSVPAVTCSILGVCNDPAMLTSATCTGTVATGALTGLVRQWKATTDIIRCEDAGGHYTGSKTNRGQIITNLCMNCHRQEASGAPMDATNPATALKVGPYHGTVPFLSHPHANQFLNSPHAKFTGTFAQIPTGQFKYDGTGEYKSYYMTEAEAGNTGNGCTGCHEVHTSIVTGDSPFREECTECHAKDLSSMMHSGGAGTPLEHMATDPMEACVSCHMPEGEHLFRISVDANYSTRPPAAMTSTVNANTAPDGNYPNAVWVDLDGACGKCHGGGIANVVTTGSITAGTKLLTVPNGALFSGEQRIEIKGAGSPYYDDDGHTKFNDDFSTYVVSVAGNVVTLAGNATKTVTNAVVEQNPVKNLAAYFTKAQLAVKAAGIHNDKPYVTFGYTVTPTNTLQVNVDASFSSCSGDLANCDAFTWNWGDGSPDTHSSTPTASHTYATPDTRAIVLTVEEYGVSEGSISKKVRTFAVDAPPAAGGTDCASIINPNTWGASLTDNSTDANGVKQVVINWGDGGAQSSAIDNTPPYTLVGTVFTHTYITAASVIIKQTAYDTIGQANIRTCPPVVLSAFTISGNARRLNNAPVSGAKVVIKKGATTIRTVYTNALGNYTVGNLKPGTYNVTATKTGLTFAQVYNQLVGPSAPGLNFQSAQ